MGGAKARSDSGAWAWIGGWMVRRRLRTGGLHTVGDGGAWPPHSAVDHELEARLNIGEKGRFFGFGVTNRSRPEL